MIAELRRRTGPAAELHGLDLSDLLGGDPFAVGVWRLDVIRPAIALGSRQGLEVVDLERCAELGLDVTRRRSGGGLVHLVPGAVLWVDVVIPTSHPARDLDIRDSMVWMGEQWGVALAAVLPEWTHHVAVHRGPERRTPWSELVCFAGVGPGEVLCDGAKLVGISQRRTRDGARFQCAVHLSVPAAVHPAYDPAILRSVLAVPSPPAGDLPPAAVVPAELADVLLDALVAGLGDDPGAR